MSTRPSLLVYALWLTALGGCTDPAADPTGLQAGPPLLDDTAATSVDSEPPEFLAGPTLAMPEPGILLARELLLTATHPVSVTVTVDDGAGPVALDLPTNLAVEHALPILGLHAERQIDIEVTITDADGSSTSTGLFLETGALPDGIPEPTILAHDPTRMQPGYTLLDLSAGDGSAAHVLIYDEQFELVWAWMGKDVSDLRMLDNGHLFWLEDGMAVEVDLLGRVHRSWAGRQSPPGNTATAVDVEWFTHEVFPVDDGFWSVTPAAAIAPHYPRSYDDPYDFVDDVPIKDMVAVKVMRDGSVANRWPLTERLDTQRIGFDALGADPVANGFEGADWAHVNAIIESPDGGALLSLRHQDALVMLDDKGEVDWILGNHEGWRPQFQDHLLTPVGDDFDWAYHQHAPVLGDDGELLVFDNGNERFTPYDLQTTPQPEYSRIVAYRVDPVARTVEQVWEYGGRGFGGLYSPATGDADWMPNGNVFADYGSLESEGGVPNFQLGWEASSVRLIEFHPSKTDDPALDVRFQSDIGEHRGWKNFRAERIASLYGAQGALQ